MKKVIAWKCKYCGDLDETLKIAQKHEMECLYNPDNKTCFTCIHFHPNKTTLFNQYPFKCVKIPDNMDFEPNNCELWEANQETRNNE